MLRRAGACVGFFRVAQDGLSAYAKHAFWLSKTDKKGVSNRDHLLQVRKVTGRAPSDLHGPPMPERLKHIWEMFLELHGGRSYNSGGPNPLSWSDLHAWASLTNTDLKPWEVHAIKALDSAWLRTVGEDSDDG